MSTSEKSTAGASISFDAGDHCAAPYWFENTGEGELVQFRVGARDRAKSQPARLEDGSVQHGRKD